jgi:hypothetical protein
VCCVDQLRPPRIAQFGASIATVSKDVTQHREPRGDSLQHIRRPVAVLNPGTMDLEADEQSDRVGHDMALARRYNQTASHEIPVSMSRHLNRKPDHTGYLRRSRPKSLPLKRNGYRDQTRSVQPQELRCAERLAPGHYDEV